MKNVEKTKTRAIVKKTAELESEIVNSAIKHIKAAEKNASPFLKTKTEKSLDNKLKVAEKTKTSVAEKDADSDKIENKNNQKRKTSEVKFKVEENWDVLKGKVKKAKLGKTRNVKTEKQKNVKKYSAKRAPELANTK